MSMPKVDIDYSSPLDAQETFARVKDFLSTDEGIRKIDSSIQCQFNEGQKSGELNGKKFKANMSVKETGDTSTVSISVDLPFMFAAFKGQVKTTIEKKLNKVLS
jgi:hypothetical protein